MADSTSAIKGPEISRLLFGGVLDYDGAGLYPGLELLNLVFRGQSSDLLPPHGTKFKLQAQDFARKLVWSSDFHNHPQRRDVLYDDYTEDAIRRLMECLQLDIPSTTKRVEWARAHFFPYTRSLIHWDARERGRQRMERRYLRGGGALAYRVLRSDPNDERRAASVELFKQLLPDSSDTPLENLTSVLARHGTSDAEPRTDRVEAKSLVLGDAYEDLYRSGVRTILDHIELSTVARIRALMNWTGFWLITIQHARAFQSLSRERDPIICDCGAEHPQLRRAAQKSFKDAQAVILEATDAKFRELTESEHHLPQAQRTKIRGFFWATAATVKLLNSWRGRRHFTLGLDLLETLVLAAIPRNEERSFEWFVGDWLYDQCGLITSRRSAERANLLDALDASVFEDNEGQLQSQMAAAGLLTEYSDSTRMVSAEGLA